jgi:hypothetical protein
MRYFAFTACLLLLAGCSRTTHIPAETNVRGIDLRPLTEAGFLVTPGDYTGGQFEAMGIVTVTVWPEANRLSASEAESQGVDADTKRSYVWVEDEITMQDALEKTRQAATEMQADALTHFDVTRVTRMESGVELEGIEVSGFAINRAGAQLSSE